MLLFIRCTALIVGELYRFQYITCYSLSIELADKVLPKNRFNTSHVTLYLLMERYLSSRTGFNTSHVTLYRLQIRRPGNRKHVSIHHMLLFIYGLEVVFTSVIWFQYITCYSLSDPRSFPLFMAETFQYITCYSLSIIRTNHQSSPSFVSIHHMLLFISSPPASSQLLHGVSIHHMLLFITVFTDSSTPLQGFNTSHVTLYQVWRTKDKHYLGFQYITCYSLSMAYVVIMKIR